jgi:hypothetical protein
MRVREVDERDSSWEEQEPTFRVYVFRGGEQPDRSWTTWTYDVVGADLIQVTQWAQHEVGDSGLYAVALVSHRASSTDQEPAKGLVWLIGSDVNSEPLSEPEAAAQERMRTLRGKPIRFG